MAIVTKKTFELPSEGLHLAQITAPKTVLWREAVQDLAEMVDSANR